MGSGTRTSLERTFHQVISPRAIDSERHGDE